MTIKATATQINRKDESNAEVEGRIWHITGIKNVEKTVCMTYKEDGRSRICFYIDRDITTGEEFAVIIDNTDWDLICFALDYTPESLVEVCKDHLDFLLQREHFTVTENAEVLEYETEWDLLTHIH